MEKVGVMWGVPRRKTGMFPRRKTDSGIICSQRGSKGVPLRPSCSFPSTKKFSKRVGLGPLVILCVKCNFKKVFSLEFMSLGLFV